MQIYLSTSSAPAPTYSTVNTLSSVRYSIKGIIFRQADFITNKTSRLLDLNNSTRWTKGGIGFIRTRGKTPVTFEPNCDADDGWQVDEAAAKAGADADGEDEREHIVREGRGRHTSRRQQRTRHGHSLAAPAVHKRTRYRACKRLKAIYLT